jgi:hypothetical protein
MKRETLRHPKLYDLMARLDCSRPTALGYLDLLWDNAADIAPQGDIGKWPNGAIARSCDWTGNADQFVEALIEAGWLDRSEEFRLVIHDWADHCQNWLRMKLQKLGLTIVSNDRSGTIEAAKATEAATAEPSAERDAERSRPCDQTEPIQTKRNQPPPPLSNAANGESAKAEPIGDLDQWGKAEEKLISSGVSRWRGLLDSFRKTGCSAEHSLELIEFWEQHQDRFDSPVGALHHRFENAHPSIPADERWPGLQAKHKPKPAPEIEVGRYAADWSLLRPSRRAELARQAQIDLSGHEGQGLRELPPALQKPIIEILARGVERKPSSKPEA